jgi:hypothetical protein
MSICQVKVGIGKFDLNIGPKNSLNSTDVTHDIKTYLINDD